MEIQFDVAPVVQRLQGMLEQIDWVKRVGLGQEMDSWQTDDLGRDKPFTLRSRARGYVRTTIHPHSYYETLRAAGRTARARRQLKAVLRRKALFLAKRKRRPRKPKPKHERVYDHWSTRPILRQQLETQLEERMSAFVRQKLSWGASKSGGG